MSVKCAVWLLLVCIGKRSKILRGRCFNSRICGEARWLKSVSIIFNNCSRRFVVAVSYVTKSLVIVFHNPFEKQGGTRSDENGYALCLLS